MIGTNMVDTEYIICNMKTIYFENKSFLQFQESLDNWLYDEEDVEIVTISQIYIPSNISESSKILTTIIYR